MNTSRGFCWLLIPAAVIAIAFFLTACTPGEIGEYQTSRVPVSANNEPAAAPAKKAPTKATNRVVEKKVKKGKAASVKKAKPAPAAAGTVSAPPPKFKKKHVWSCDPTVQHKFFGWCDGPDHTIKKGPK